MEQELLQDQLRRAWQDNQALQRRLETALGLTSMLASGNKVQILACSRNLASSCRVLYPSMLCLLHHHHLDRGHQQSGLAKTGAVQLQGSASLTACPMLQSAGSRTPGLPSSAIGNTPQAIALARARHEAAQEGLAVQQVST